MSKTLTQIDADISAVESLLAHPENLGGETEVYARVTGYYRATNGWNAGKVSELHDRKMYHAA
jgi:ribonucleoside-triphosphate reductase